MKPCVMCKVEFDELKDLDFVGRCDDCFHLYMSMPEDQRPHIGTPYTPIYNGKAKYGF